MARKLWALICAGVLGLAGCGSSDGGDAGGKVTLTYAIWDNENQGEAMGKIVKEFTRTHPDIDVEIQFTPNKEYGPSSRRPPRAAAPRTCSG
ncbi:hypothetical protein [Nonomuraea sp. SBT364]|uniref:hypothetical protein n=1 Tax=Nonomuraea sp. SBT364 TaxID=1580530 RepID=UPI00066A8FD6|nr:hypothetical protein [Nonomuraea sp. SBT364]